MTRNQPAASRPGSAGRRSAGTADLWRHEVGRSRVAMLLVALFAVVWACYLAILAVEDPRVHALHDLRQPAWIMLQGFLPLICGVGAAMMSTPGLTAELHLSLPTSLRATLTRRFALITMSSLALAMAGWLAIDPALLWGQGHASTLLSIVAPLVLYSATAALVGALSGSARAASAVVVVVWIAQVLLQVGDAVLLAGGAAALVATWFVLRSEERLLRAATSS